MNGTDWKDTWTNDGTVNRNNYALDINCGLKERPFDLAVGTDVYSATLNIHGKTTTYTYNQILNGEAETDLDTLLNNNISKDATDVNYNLNIYNSDYNYRIDDYVDGVIQNKDVIDDSNINDGNDIKGNLTTDDQLKVFVTYKVVLKNQSTYDDAWVNELAYYYDNNYTLNSVYYMEGESPIAIPIDPSDNIDSSVMAGKHLVKIKDLDKLKLNKESGYVKEIYLVFQINENDKHEILPNLKTGITCANIVEILSYGSTEGLIDNDSCPGNAQISYEDDTDEAKGLNIKAVKESRTITGTVWDDSEDANPKNGIMDVGAKGINDVIVQLIELKQYSGTNYEYIWQETRSGSGEGKRIDPRNSSKLTSYTYAGGNGIYVFNDFIPGDYIIRFIYGDGRTYDVTPNVQQYNGQDYKSTKDAYYNKEYYNIAGYSDDASKARDNEARRLKVMSYSTSIDEAVWNEIEGKTATMLQQTWMCAETSKISVPIDAEDLKTVFTTSNTVAFENVDNSVKFEKVNFGLMVRPQTKLKLEKHITGLKITPTGVGAQPIVDAKIDIADVLDDNGYAQSEIKGVKTGLAEMRSERNDRGFWQVQTDLEELTQGATLEVTYTYVIKNESGDDYLSSSLVQEFNNFTMDNEHTYTKDGQNSYENYLNHIAKQIKGGQKGNTYKYGQYLGQYYYTLDLSKVDAREAKVSSRVETIEECLNNDLDFVVNPAGSAFEIIEPTDALDKIKTKYNSGGEQENITIKSIIRNTAPSKILTKGESDTEKTVLLTAVLSSSSDGVELPSYIAQILSYKNAAGRRDIESCPGNLSYVHSDDNTMTLDGYKYEIQSADGSWEIHYGDTIPAGARNAVKLNEIDEFWGETIKVTKPTGEDKLTPVQITIISVSSIAVLGVGIILIKKFILKK